MSALQIAKHKLKMALIAAMKPAHLPQPTLLVGEGSSLRLCRQIATRGLKKLMLVTDADLVRIGLHKEIVATLEKEGVEVTIYSEITPNPTIEQMNQGISVGKQNQCSGILALGGGSPIDAAKIIAAAITNDMPVTEMEGLAKIKQPPLPLFAIPTTAGTGSEATIASVVTNTQEQRKFTVANMMLVPLSAALDPALMVGLPPAVTAATGVDVLTHAIEAFVATSAKDKTKDDARLAVRLTFRSLREAYNNGSNLLAREDMAMASYYAGVAIADAGVGYVHAIAHQLGGLYHVPHGLANAVVLPHVLDASKGAITAELAELAQLVGLGNSGDSDAVLADHFIQAVRELNRDLGLPEFLKEIRREDVPLIVDRAREEAFNYFAVPKYLSLDEGRALVQKLIPTSA